MYRYFPAAVTGLVGLKRSLWLIPAVLLSGCFSIPSDQQTVLMEPVREVTVPPTEKLELHVPVGEVKVMPATDGQFSGELRIYCESDSGRCAKRVEQAKFVTTVAGNVTRVATEPTRAMRLRSARLEYIFYVPTAETLDILMGPGSLIVDKVSPCVEVDMDAGDLEITALESQVKGVQLRANFGDASLKHPDNRVDGNRKLLVGARVDWNEGKGDCTIKGHLQAGDLRVRLE